MLNITRDIPDIFPVILFENGIFAFATSTLTLIMISFVAVIVSYLITKRFSKEPTKFQVALEMIHDQIIDLVANITGDPKRSKELFPLIATLFLFLVVTNLITLIPGISEVTYGGQSLFAHPTADINTTMGLALALVIFINLMSIKEWGILSYLGKFFQFKQVYQGFRKGFGSGMTAIIEFFVGILDIIGEVAKVISLALRLFGNMYAGNVLMIVLFGFVAYAIPALWLTMNFFVGILQALVFAALTASYYMLAVKPTETLDPSRAESASDNTSKDAGDIIA